MQLHIIPRIILITCLLAGCKKFLDIDAPKSLIVRQTVFEDDITATQAVTGMYNTMYLASSYSSGSDRSVVSLCGMSADELLKYPRSKVSSTNYYEFDENRLTARNQYIQSMWASMYKLIYQANDIIEGLSTSSKVSESVKTQLRGEALVVRAFTYFYIINLFGDAPLALNTDYEANARLPRAPKADILAAVVKDLLEAKTLLSENYVTGERVRPNKTVATALLARVYLYMGNWEQAEVESSAVISNNAVYNLPSDLNTVFLTTSTEAIWQQFPGNNINSPSAARTNSQEGAYFIPASAGEAPRYVLTDALLNAFEPGDRRKLSWIAEQGPVHYPFKYKVPENATTITEYSVILRLAEQHLIRAEARAQLNKLEDAISDIDLIRDRAGLPLIADSNPAITKEALLLAIGQERRIEFFAEWGHRWLDLKRTGRANDVLGALKAGWTESDLLYPLPQIEFSNNPYLGDQNPDY